MNGFHTYYYPGRSSHLDVKDFELVCWVASVSYWIRHFGRMDLYYDSDSEETLVKLGVFDLYNNKFKMGKPKDGLVNFDSFWTYGKILSAAMARVPFCSVDMDCIFWQKPVFDSHLSVIGLNWDDPSFNPYSNRKSFVTHQVADVPWDEVGPMNAGVFCVQNNGFQVAFLGRALAYIREFSRVGVSDPGAMMFIEQLIPCAVAKKCGLDYGVLEQAGPETGYHVSNERVTHLWGTKKQYGDDPGSSKAFIEGVLGRMREDGMLHSLEILKAQGIS